MLRCFQKDIDRMGRYWMKKCGRRQQSWEAEKSQGLELK
jgi:hypothetical protein